MVFFFRSRIGFFSFRLSLTVNMSSRARSRFVRKRKKPVGRAVATNENYYPMKIRPLITRKKSEGICTHRINDKQRQVSLFSFLKRV